MTGTFGSLNIAKTGLQYQQLVMDTASNNIANVSTDGYVRRSVVGGELGSTAVSALWSTSSNADGGVGVQSVQRLTDQLVDNRVRREHGTLSSLLTQQTALSNVEGAINEPSDTGVAAALAAFRSSLQDVSPDVAATTSTVLAKAQTLVQTIRAQAQSIADEQGDLSNQASTDVAQINEDAKQLAQLNHSIFVGQSSGADVGALLDQRDQVALDLANRAGATSTVGADGRMTVTVGNGQKLVDGEKAYAVGGTGPSSYTLVDPTVTGDPGTSLAFASGEMGGIAAASASLQTYRDGLDGVVADLVQRVNDAQAAGYDTAGHSGGPFFDPSGTSADTIALQLTDGSQIAAAGPSGAGVANYDSSNVNQLWSAADVGASYQKIVTTLGAQVAGLNSSVTSQQAVATQADDAREQQAGVSLDEETINMVAAQHAYEASSKVLTVMDSILDTIINHTGLTA